MIALTGATGQLGHYVLQDLLKTVPASQIVAIVRNPAKAQALSQQGVVVRQAEYGDEAASRRPSGLRKTTTYNNSLAHRTTWLRSDLKPAGRRCPSGRVRR